MSEKERGPDWCIVRWHDGELLVYRRYQWVPQAKRFANSYKWEYVAEGIQSNEEAIDWVRKYEKLLKE
jgi:hypothetical protein